MQLWTKVKHYPRLGLILLAFIAFVALGLPDGLLGVGWPSIRTGFSIPLDAIGMLLTASVAGYMTSSFLSGFLLARVGVGRVLAASCLLTGMALIGYTLVPGWWLMVLLGVFAGLGAGAIDAGLNTYVAANFGEGLMQWLHASWGVGITIGPILMTLGLTALNTWYFGYRVVGVFQLTLAIGFVLTLAMWSRNETPSEGQAEKKLTEYKTPLGETLRQPQVWLSLMLFFLYVGAEAALGTWTYTLLTESRGVDHTLAGFFAGSYWFTFTIGRILAGLVARRIGGGAAGRVAADLESIRDRQRGRRGDHRPVDRAHLPRHDVGHAPAGRRYLRGQYNRHANGGDGFWHRGHPQPDGRAGAPDLTGSHPGLPAGGVCRAVRLLPAGDQDE
jgi:fucose permease